MILPGMLRINCSGTSQAWHVHLQKVNSVITCLALACFQFAKCPVVGASSSSGLCFLCLVHHCFCGCSGLFLFAVLLLEGMFIQSLLEPWGLPYLSLPIVLDATPLVLA